MSIGPKVFYRISQGVRKLNLPRFYKLKNDNRGTANFKLLYFCGEKGIDYLNASLISVYKNWKELPELIIASDGTSEDLFREKMIKWPRHVDIIPWEKFAEAHKVNGNIELYSYACKKVFGRKLAAILDCAGKFPVLFCDTDVLWFGHPEETERDFNIRPVMAMSIDVVQSYDEKLLEELGTLDYLNNNPYNAGIVFAAGKFNSYPLWDKLCKYVGSGQDLGYFAEQTFMAVLNNYFNPSVYWDNARAITRIDDRYSMKYTGEKNPLAVARHYVSLKDTAFWRDFFIMLLKDGFILHKN
jgi:hypothetical protein